MAAAAIGQDRYPEIMGKFFIINAPWAFSAIWAIVKVWLDEVTVNKIDIIICPRSSVGRVSALEGVA